MSYSQPYGVFEVTEALHNTLRSYLESAYHIRNRSLINERNLLLRQTGLISQEPYVESTPSYKIDQSYDYLRLPDTARRMLSNLAILSPSVGIYPRPYQHQADALEAFLSDGNDIIVATGTGSGKTESFLMPILGSLAFEGANRPKTASLPGCRAILLYPMNALVNDQLSRIRRLFGDERVANLLSEGRNRPVRFGSYTSRTPYPGLRNGSKDYHHIRPLFENFYLKYSSDQDMIQLLKEKGKWPSKDLVRFFDKGKEEAGTYRTGKLAGKQRIKRNWNERLKTQPNDRELLTRHEMQSICPDILITNYSMLEYMLMRPIERSLFQQTKTWLEADPDNQLILVLDEAHMYRGTGGAEVALLLRRLVARLGISRKQIRFILTSASLGEGQDADLAVVKFAQELTGLSVSEGRTIKLIKGTKEERIGERIGTIKEARSLASMDLGSFQNIVVDNKSALKAVKEIATLLDWPTPPDDSKVLTDYLFNRLTGWGPAELMVNSLSGKAVRLRLLAQSLFPDINIVESKKATETLIALGTFARRHSDGRVFLPTRLHLFYRGLPGLFACTSPDCNERIDKNPPVKPILGKLYTSPRLSCTCNDKARVYELLTHRDCGSAFLRAYVREDDQSFLLHEPTNFVGMDEDLSVHLQKIEVLVEGQPHPEALKECAKVWLDIKTGHLLKEEPVKKEDFREVFVSINDGKDGRTFKRCPICLRRWKGRSKIMDLATKGEAPFANLVKGQLFFQPPRMSESLAYPNGGRKVLLFSDGRQKAARLARDIPREVEWDSFRQAIALAAVRYKKIRYKDPKINLSLYSSFVSVVSEYNLQFFDGGDHKELTRTIKEFREEYNGDLEFAIDNEWQRVPPSSYYKALLRQLCHQEFSLRAATVGCVKPAFLQRIVMDVQKVSSKLTPTNVEELAIAYINDILVDDNAFETEALIAPTVRQEAAGHPQESWVSEGKISEALRNILKENFGLTSDQIVSIEDIIQQRLCYKMGTSSFVIKGDAVALSIDTDSPWYLCELCTYLSPVRLDCRCINCGSTEIDKLDPHSSEYIKARKGFLRDSVDSAIKGLGRPKHVSAEEHTAQLSQRDKGVVFATTEKYELRFQDVVIEGDIGPIDVLSSTTTMEVGIDIGSLVAVGLRNVPPQRENYQQRAGRAGRRGSSVSTVITYAQGGPHDSHYFHNPDAIVAGPPRMPLLKTDNEKIARRHIQAYLIQTFFHELIDKNPEQVNKSGSLFSVLGSVTDFFNNDPENDFNISEFEIWVKRRVIYKDGDLIHSIVDWLPEGITQNLSEWVRQVAVGLLDRLVELKDTLTVPTMRLEDEDNLDEEENESDHSLDLSENQDEFLTFLFDQGFLPSYAFPTNLCSFVIEETEKRRGGIKVIVKERPQQSIDKALSEYAPGRLIVVDKVTYRSGGITSNSARVTEPDRATALFDELRPYIACRRCTFVQDNSTDPQELDSCPVCEGELDKGDLLIPEVFHPDKGKAVSDDDRDQEFTYATSAQFPLPLAGDDLTDWKSVGQNVMATHANNRRLVMVNKGHKDTSSGFSVCVKCGSSSIYDPEKPRKGSHMRPYQVEPRPGVHVPYNCDGEFRRVYLGHQFSSDLLVLRSNFEVPLVRRIETSLPNSVINDSLRTVSEAMLLAASQELDLDPNEFQVGFRLIPTTQNSSIQADIFLFDTLSGGAGYAEQVGEQLNQILKRTLQILEDCPGHCDRSCTECLRHYQNQYWHPNLDRHLGAKLLRYMMEGEIPTFDSANDQCEKLQGLIRLLELDEYRCSSDINLNRGAPLVVTLDNLCVTIGTYPALLEENDVRNTHPLVKSNANSSKVKTFLVSDYLLTHNLPLVYNRVKNLLYY